jgi:flagella basal body P-ring formation protein FlgA
MNNATDRNPTTRPPAASPRRPARLLLAGLAAGVLAHGADAQDNTIGAEALRSLAVAAVEQQLPESDIARGANRTEVEAGSIDSRLRLAACALTPQVQVDLTRGSGRYNARVSCPAPAPWSLYVPIEVRVFRDVVVSNRAMERGQTIGASDLRLEERNVLATGAGALMNLEDAVGFSLRRNVPVNAMLNSGTVEPPLLVRRGDRIQVSVRAGGINVSAVGEALRDGRLGERIPVRNIQSKRVVEAVVTGAGRGEAT